ncbi:nicotinamide riboside transporter PnuC [Helicobacter anatolicus]|uniref:nicotinamide riboside transporter PnuC n=1 Tax=Helicobacter anatolicus TaxID=2905874 RepID=UPI001E55AE6E|nr:nicotinamide riboside transporter PnuC [Helicobacter anatolicus]MCE3039128.1 nicotinamide riboside transporter PnuC [Helicobacter anatolicus]
MLIYKIKNFLSCQFTGLNFSFWIIFICACFLITIPTFYTQDFWINFFIAILGLSYAFFAGAKKAICHIFGIFYAILSIILSFEIKLYAEMLLNISYLFLNTIGFFLWSKNQNSTQTQITIQNLPHSITFIYLFVILILSILHGFILKNFNASFAFLNSLTLFLQIFALFLQVKRYIQNYLFITLANILTLYIWIKFVFVDSKYIFQFLNTLIFLFIGIYYYWQWSRK